MASGGVTSANIEPVDVSCTNPSGHHRPAPHQSAHGTSPHRSHRSPGEYIAWSP